MASVKKHTDAAVYNVLRHSNRTIPNSSNVDIDVSRTADNYCLHPDRNMGDYDYYKQLKQHLYVFQRKDVKTMATWVITCPKEITDRIEQERFFRSCYRFLTYRYGGEVCCVSCWVHADEAGKTPHMHFCFVPISKDAKHGGYKICANDVLNRADLRGFHDALEKHLKADGIDAQVKNGSTSGGNKSVRELKQETEIECLRKQVRELSQRVISMEQQRDDRKMGRW